MWLSWRQREIWPSWGSCEDVTSAQRERQGGKENGRVPRGGKLSIRHRGALRGAQVEERQAEGGTLSRSPRGDRAIGRRVSPGSGDAAD